MKKTFLSLCLVLAGSLAFSQAPVEAAMTPVGNVGVNVVSPRTSLDVAPNGSYSILVNTGRIGEVADPLVADDAATKGYVDALLGAMMPAPTPIGLDTVICINDGGGSHKLTFTAGVLTGYVNQEHHCDWYDK